MYWKCVYKNQSLEKAVFENEFNSDSGFPLWNSLRYVEKVVEKQFCENLLESLVLKRNA